MALVRNIKPWTKNNKAQEEVNCFSSDFTDEEGNCYLQLDTTGSKSKKMKGATTQSIRFDERAAYLLKQLIDKTFPKLK